MKEKSVGIILSNKNHCIRYLLLYRKAGNHFRESWDFPKGNLEINENELETLNRELKEETGISKFVLIKNFREKINLFYRREGNTISKEIIFYLGKTDEEKVMLSSEHDEFRWCPYDEALNLLTHKNSKEILKKADKRLKSSLSNFL